MILKTENIPRAVQSRAGTFEYFILSVFIFYIAFASRLVLFSSFRDQPVIFFVPVLLTGILTVKKRVQFDKAFYLLIFFYLFYFFALTIKYQKFYPSLLVQYPSIFFMAYVLIKALRYELFRVYEQIIYVLAIIGIFFWVIQFALGGDTLYNLIGRIPNIHEFSHVTGNGLNIVLYSIQPTSFSTLYGNTPPRNCGFAWEPGAFAVYLCLAIFINLFLTKKNKTSRRHLVIFFIALLTTQSTTGFVILIIIGLFYLINTNLKTVFILMPFGILLVVFLLSLPFMTEKIIHLVEDVERVNVTVEAGYGRETSITPQRFTSFAIAIKDFYLNPVFGTGGIKGESWTEKIGVNVSTITGIGNLLANYGLVGFLFFIIVTYNTSSLFSRQFKYKGKILFFLIIFSILVSYNILFFPLITTFWIFGLFQKHDPELVLIENE